MKNLSILIIWLMTINLSYAMVPEPDVIIYGKVINRYKGADTILNDGKLTWKIKAREGEQETYQYDTELESLNNGQFSYRLYIPQKVAGDMSILPSLEISDLNDSKDTIPLETEHSQYDLISISLDEFDVQILSPSQKFVNMGQDLRSQNIHIDLMISKPPQDTDNDGLPDLWEEQYGLNINKPDDAVIDLDGDGLTNLEEFDLASNPIINNSIPSLRINEMLIYEQGKVQFRPYILDSDTPADKLWFTFKYIPSNIKLTSFESDDYEAGYIFKANDRISVKDIEQGKIILTHTPQKTEAWGAPEALNGIIFTIDDGDHDPVDLLLTFKLYMPSATDGSDANTWIDANVDKSIFTQYQTWLSNNVEGYHNPVTPEMTFFGRSGSKITDQLISYSYDGWNGTEIKMTNQGLPQGLTAINMLGNHFLEYYTDSQKRTIKKPFNISNDSSLFAVIKAQGSENQVIATDTLSEFSVTGNNHTAYARRLRFAITEEQAVYSAMPIDREWGIAGLFRENNSYRLEWNGNYNGGHFPKKELTHLSSSYSLGGKVMGSSTSADYHATDTLKGGIGEVLIYNKPIKYEDKWKIYAYLLSKWFDYVVLDASNMTTDTRLMAASASELIINDEIKDAVSNPTLLENIKYFDELLFIMGDRVPDQTDQYDDFKAVNGPDSSYILIGGLSKDELVGGWENDILVAGFGEDRLTGLGGADHFVVRDKTTVVDFDSNEGDVIDLSYLLQPGIEISIDKYIRLNANKYGTSIYVDINGDESGYTDATIFLANVTLHNYDLPQLWADGGIITGGPRPEISLSLVKTAMSEEDWNEINGKPFEIFLNGYIPNGMLLPLDLVGKAEPGKDYHIGIDYYDPKLDITKIYETYDNSLPVSLKQRDPLEIQPKIYIFPHKDGVTEPPENLSLILRNVPDYYDIDPDNSKIDLMLTDGTNQVSIVSTLNKANELYETNGEIMISRNGSYDRDLDVKLIVQGTAKMGDDYYYIPSEVTIPKGKQELSIPVRPINDLISERDRVIEIFVVENEDYEVNGPASARVTITDKAAKPGDIDGNDIVDLKDLIMTLQVCAGKDISNIYMNGDMFGDKRIGLSDALYMMRVISR